MTLRRMLFFFVFIYSCCCFLLIFLFIFLVPLFDHFKRRAYTELDVESRVEIDFVECLQSKSFLRLTDFIYEEIDLLVILSLHLLFSWGGDDRLRVFLLTSKFTHLLQDLIWFESFQAYFSLLALLCL